MNDDEAKRKGCRPRGATPTPQPPPLGNCPKCRTPMAPDIKLCTSCGARVDEVPSVDRPRA